MTKALKQANQNGACVVHGILYGSPYRVLILITDVQYNRPQVHSN